MRLRKNNVLQTIGLKEVTSTFSRSRARHMMLALMSPTLLESPSPPLCKSAGREHLKIRIERKNKVRKKEK